MINSKIQKIKNKLIAFGYLDNEYLDKYLALLEANLTASRCLGGWSRGNYEFIKNEIKEISDTWKKTETSDYNQEQS